MSEKEWNQKQKIKELSIAIKDRNDRIVLLQKSNRRLQAELTSGNGVRALKDELKKLRSENNSTSIADLLLVTEKLVDENRELLHHVRLLEESKKAPTLPLVQEIRDLKNEVSELKAEKNRLNLLLYRLRLEMKGE